MLSASRRSYIVYKVPAWRIAVMLAGISLWLTCLTGCTRKAPAPPPAAVAPPPVLISPKFRPDPSGPQLVKIVEDDSELAHVRVQASDGSNFYVHRSFLNKTGRGNELLTVSELFKKPAGEDYYFTLEEIGRVRDTIPGLYMTPSGRQVVAPWKTPQFHYQNEWAWPVYECTKADCPGRFKGEKHGVLFILPDPTITPDVDIVHFQAERDRKISAAPSRTHAEKAASAVFLCPQCRERGRPDPEEAYKQAFRRYRLPESEAMWQELDTEYSRSRDVRARKFHPSSAAEAVTNQ